MISNIRKNIMGTVSFAGKFDGMRKAQDFIVYPFHVDNPTFAAMVQSDTRIGRIHMQTGALIMSPSRPGGSFGVHLAIAKPAGCLNGEELLLLKAAIFATASSEAGDNSLNVVTDNSGALEVFGH